ncbi:MAG: tRNA (guanosine(46)-N7)-methyltransferase TrmB [Gammaproteobacteria bacterium]|nr:tRNA (guanosine(46)-N7)-methyltransferase TrmB [Gammaproteobacteria bacterium]
MTSASSSRPPIKSYVRRTGRLTAAQKNALIEYWSLYGINFQDSQIDLEALSHGFEALKLEIGFGNGEALISMAKNDPEALYLGVEVHESGVGRCLNSIHEGAIENIRLIKHDAVEVMQKMLPSQSLDRVLLFFPDPWHKRRHNKRRIVNQVFRDLLAHLLKPGGVVHMATDWRDYAEHMAAEMLSDPRFENSGGEAGYSEKPAYRPLTHFENRGVKLGHGVWDLVFRKS